MSTGAQRIMISDSLTASSNAMKVSARPLYIAIVQCWGLLSTPIIFPVKPLLFNAFASDPPMRPIPTIQIVIFFLFFGFGFLPQIRFLYAPLLRHGPFLLRRVI